MEGQGSALGVTIGFPSRSPMLTVHSSGMTHNRHSALDSKRGRWSPPPEIQRSRREQNCQQYGPHQDSLCPSYEASVVGRQVQYEAEQFFLFLDQFILGRHAEIVPFPCLLEVLHCECDPCLKQLRVLLARALRRSSPDALGGLPRKESAIEGFSSAANCMS